MGTLSRYEAAPGVSSARLLRWVVALPAAAFACLLDWQERAQERHHLARLDDHMLRDIGVSRTDIMHEASKPFWRL
jgi:uncharacterized protein YjiS (DUF1127 family)